jgi:hypothetical protein
MELMAEFAHGLCNALPRREALRVEPRRPRTSGPIPKFVNARGILQYELRNLRTTSNSMNLVRLLNLKFLNTFAAMG